MAEPLIANIEGNKLRRVLQQCIGNVCDCLATAIEELLNGNSSHGSGEKGLKQHWAEQTQPGATAPGTDVWNKHQTTIRDQQRNQRDLLREYDERGCDGPGGGSPVPEDAWRWATRPLPIAEDWGANNPAAYEGLTGSPLGDAAVVASGIGAVYLLYRGIRMLPSLAPPLWWTIPGNVAIP